MSFSTQLSEIELMMRHIKTDKYAASRNYKNGAVSRLGPYISRGVLSTKKIYTHLKSTGVSWQKAEKFIQELAWRDYWQEVWIAKGEGIFSDLKREQENVVSKQIPQAVINAQTGIEAIDEGINELIKTGYMHNHMRMYVAAICCNVGQCHWSKSARWMYYHLLDGDLASNMLSWQWVAGSNANKKYYANQSNINAFFESAQRKTFLDRSYESFDQMEIPEVLKKHTTANLQCSLDGITADEIDSKQTTLVYNYYNLDPYWHGEEELQRVYLLEPWLFEKFPISKKCLDFSIALSKNIQNIKIFVGDFKSLQQKIGHESLIYKEHPLNQHYQGTEENRDWLCSVKGYHKSFFSFWKKCKKEIQW